MATALHSYDVMPNNYLPLTITGLRAAIDADPAFAEAAAQAQFDHARRFGDRYNCFVQRNELSEGWQPKRTGVLNGVALAHKDVFNSGRRAPFCGQRSPLEQGPLERALVLERLESSGAADLGALVMAELACGPTGDNPHYPRPVNPLDEDAAVGGSSSGSAVAVAAGLCYASLGTDTSGSVRIPAATCGVVGFKPTFGRIPRAGAMVLSPSLDTVGILARSAADVALLLRTIADEVAPKLGGDGLQQTRDETKRWRIRNCIPMERFAPSVRNAVDDFLGAIADFADIREGRIDGLSEANRLCAIILHVEAAHTLASVVTSRLPSLATSTQSIALPGFAIPAIYYADALQQRTSIKNALLEGLFRDDDIVLLPALAEEVPSWDEVQRGSPDFNPDKYQALYEWMPCANLTGLPAVVFPIRSGKGRRVISVQAMARPLADEELLGFTYRVECSLFGPDGVLTPPTRIAV